LSTFGDHGFLATGIAPARLLGAAARRAARAARDRILPPLAPHRDRLLEILGCEGAATLARLLARPRPGPAPWTPASLRASLDAFLPGETERAVARAEAAACGRIVLCGQMVDVARPGGGTDWQLDPVHGGRFAAWAPSHALPPAPWLDPLLALAVGRGEQWVALAQGAALDPRRGPELAAALAASVADFCAENPVGHGVHWTRASEAALRAWNLALALWILGGARIPPGSGLAVDAARLLVVTGRFVLAHLDDGDGDPPAALATDWLGLLACAEGLPEWPESRRWRTLALAGLSTAFEAQVSPEGVAREGALPSQRLACELFAAAALLRLGARRGLGRAGARRLAALFAATRALLASDGSMPGMGETDVPRLLALRDRAPGEGRHLLSLGAALLRAPALLAGRGPGDAVEVAWLFGPGPLSALARAPGGPAPRSGSFPAAGHHVLRRGPFEAFVSCGARGPGGGDATRDPGLSLELRVHGALAVRAVGLEERAGRDTRELSSGRLLTFEPGGRADRLTAERCACAAVVHRREVHVAAAGVAILDRLAGAGAHRVELRWAFASPGALLRSVAAAEAEALDALARAARLPFAAERSRAVEVASGEHRLLVALALPPGLALTLAPSPRAPIPGALADGSAAVAAGAVRCPASLATLVVIL
jgi:hypothetical protein